MNPQEHLILYVDDEHANRVVFEITFGKKFRIKSVESAEQALAVFAEHEDVAVVVSDQRMTGMSGDDLLRRVKEISPDTIRMIVTAYSDLEPILSAVNDGLVARYVIKPWDRKELEEILTWAVEAYVMGRQNSALQLRLIQTERLRTLGQVSASVLHDLNQPVMAVSMSAEQLNELARASDLLNRLASGDTKLDANERNMLSELAADLPDIASTLTSCASFMSDLMKQMKQFQRHDTAPPTSRDIAPLPVIKLGLTMCRGGSLISGAKLSYDGPPDLPQVRATSTDFLQVLVNLVRNAQQALEEHGVKNGTVIVRAEADASSKRVRFTVRDNGPGIPAEVITKLGTPFYTTRENGTGLGISQCRRLVGRLGGEVSIESTMGEGTAVTFTIPMTDAF